MNRTYKRGKFTLIYLPVDAPIPQATDSTIINFVKEGTLEVDSGTCRYMFNCNGCPLAQQYPTITDCNARATLFLKANSKIIRTKELT